MCRDGSTECGARTRTRGPQLYDFHAGAAGEANERAVERRVLGDLQRRTIVAAQEASRSPGGSSLTSTAHHAQWI